MIVKKKFFERGELKILWPFYLETLFANVFLIFPIFWIIQFQETLQLSQVGIIFSVIALSTFLFEVPTGAIADIFGRKSSVVIGLILSGITLFLVTFTKEFYLILSLFFLLGLFSTLISGADISWVADNLKYNRKSKLLQTFFVKRASLLNLAFVFAGFIGGVLVKYFGLNIIWPISGFSMILSGIMLLFVKEHKHKNKNNYENLFGVFRQTFTSMKFSWNHQKILSFSIISLLTGFLLSFAGDLIWKPYLLDFEIPLSYFGYLFSIATGLGVIAPFVGLQMVKRIGKDKLFFALVLILEAFFLVFAIFALNWLVLAIIMILFVFCFDVFEPIKDNHFQRYLPSDKRATISSLFSMLFSIGIIIGGPLAGLTADHFGFKITLSIGILFIIPMILLFVREK